MRSCGMIVERILRVIERLAVGAGSVSGFNTLVFTSHSRRTARMSKLIDCVKSGKSLSFRLAKRGEISLVD
jgi:hypothetical protein